MTRAYYCVLLSTTGFLAALAGGCGLGPVSSDVPILAPDWGDGTFGFLVRPEIEGSRNILLTAQLSKLEMEHESVYRYDAERQTFELVDDSIWDNATSTITKSSLAQQESPLFDIGPYNVPRPTMTWAELEVGVDGGTPLSFFNAPLSEAVAVLSTNGEAPTGIPFISSGKSRPGQRFHRLFAESNGQAIGPAVRLGLGGYDREGLDAIWTPDEEYVIYSEGYSQVLFLSVVPVGEVLRTDLPQRVSDHSCFVPEEWGYGQQSGYVFIRTAGNDANTLLLAEDSGGSICANPNDDTCETIFEPHTYAFDGSTGEFSSVPATPFLMTEITMCGDVDATPPAPLTVEGEFFPKLFFAGQPVDLAGGNFVGVFASPNSSMAAVLSSDGVVLRDSFRNYAYASGQHYHRLISLTSGQWIGEASRVSVGGLRSDRYVGCWSYDERYLAYVAASYYVEQAELYPASQPVCVISME